MIINLRTNYSEPNRVHKNSVHITELRDCILKESTSIIHPTFIVKANYDTVAKCNYIYVRDFNRYYFVNDIISVRNGIIEFVCTCDVLSTFWDEVKINDAIIRRNESSFNMYINDGSVMEYQDPYITNYYFNDVFSDFNYVLLVAGSGGTTE